MHMNRISQVLQAVPFDSSPAKIDWNALPELVHPLGGQLPPERLDKKMSTVGKFDRGRNRHGSPRSNHRGFLLWRWSFGHSIGVLATRSHSILGGEQTGKIF